MRNLTVRQRQRLNREPIYQAVVVTCVAFNGLANEQTLAIAALVGAHIKKNDRRVEADYALVLGVEEILQRHVTDKEGAALFSALGKDRDETAIAA